MSEMWTEWGRMIFTFICSVVASSGFWAWLQRRAEKKDVKTQMLIGLAHDRIMSLGLQYLERGWLTHDEYENLVTYLYEPYAKMGGNGSAKHIIDRVNRLPVRDPFLHLEEGDISERQNI